MKEIVLSYGGLNFWGWDWYRKYLPKLIHFYNVGFGISLDETQYVSNEKNTQMRHYAFFVSIIENFIFLVHVHEWSRLLTILVQMSPSHSVLEFIFKNSHNQKTTTALKPMTERSKISKNKYPPNYVLYYLVKKS